MNVSDEIGQSAKDELESAIQRYYAIVEPDALVTEWLIITHKVPADITQGGTSWVGTNGPTGQGWVVTRGMLDVALEAHRQELINLNPPK